MTDSPEQYLGDRARQKAKIALGKAYIAVEAEFPGISPAFILAGFGEMLAVFLAVGDARLSKAFLSCLEQEIQACMASSNKTTSPSVKPSTRLM